MSVQVATLDILVDRAHFEPAVARAIGDAITMEIEHSTLEKRMCKVEAQVAELSQRVTELTQRMENGFAALRLEMERHKTDVVRWMFGGFVSTFLATVAAMYFMLQSLR